MRILSFSLKIMLLALIPALTFMSCDNDDPETATISGTITFDNMDLWETWKDSGEVQVVIFPEYSLDPFPGAGWGDVPDNFYGPGVPGGRFALGAPYNAQNPVVLNLTAGDNTYDYEIEVDPGTYSALAVGFRHDFVTDPTTRTATLGVYWDNPTVVSHGIVLRLDIGGGQVITIIDEPAPETITVEAGDELDLDFRADLSILNVWPFHQ